MYGIKTTFLNSIYLGFAHFLSQYYEDFPRKFCQNKYMYAFLLEVNISAQIGIF